MEAIIQIFGRLGVDGTVFIQFALFCVLYLICAPFFMKKLQFVLEQRESKTTQLRVDAEKKLEEVKELTTTYDEKVNQVRVEVQTDYTQRKTEVIAESKKTVKELEVKLNKEFEAERSEFITEVEGKKAELFKEVESLSNQLVEQLK